MALFSRFYRHLPAAPWQLIPLLLGLSFHCTATAKPNYPEGLLGQRLAAMTEALAHPKQTDFKLLVNTHFSQELLTAFPVTEHLAYFQAVAAELQGYQLAEITPQGGGGFYLLFTHNKTPEARDPKQFQIEFMPNAPHGLVGFQPAAYVDFAKLNIDDWQALDKQLQRLAADNIFSGNLLIEQQGKVLFSGAYGFADKRFGVANTATTRFPLASISKDFTAIAILQLAQAGKLQLDQTIVTWLPELQQTANTGDKDKTAITIRQLLQHRSGLGEYFFVPEYEHNKHQFQSQSDYLPIIAKESLSFAPGSAQAYSNSGFELLGIIVERVSGLAYWDYLQQHIFTPAGMTQTEAHQPTLVQPLLARSYTNFSDLGPEQDYLRESTYIPPAIGNASGGAISNLEDMQRYLRALHSDTLLTKTYRGMLFNGFNPQPPKRWAKAGAGGAPGISTLYVSNAELGLNVIMLSNYDERLAEDIALHLYRQFKALSSTTDPSTGKGQ